MGIRRKILSGFVGILILLIFSSLVSLFELERLSKSTQEIIDKSSQTMKATQAMLNIIHDQNTTLLQLIILSDSTNHSNNEITGKKNFIDAKNTISSIFADSDALKQVTTASKEYEKVLKNFTPIDKQSNAKWFIGEYHAAYSNLTRAIKDYHIKSQDYLSDQTQLLEKSAYRASTPNTLTFAVLIMVIGMFLFFVDLYFLKPIINIDQSLKNYVTNKIPFNVKVDSNDEIQSLRDSVEKLIMLYKNKKRE